MKILKLYFFFLYCGLLIFWPVPLPAQAHLAVDVQHPVYKLLEIAEVKGALTWLPQAKPYPFSLINTYLNQIDEGHGFSETENAILRGYKDLFRRRKGPVSETNPNWGGTYQQGTWGNFAWGVNEETEVKVNINDLDAWHMYNGVRLYLKGDFTPFLSYYGNFGITYDKVGPDSFTPYAFTKQWDGYHLNFGEKRYSFEGIEPYPFFSFILENEITGFFFDQHLLTRFARLRREWGMGEGSLYLSGTGRPFEGLDLQVRLSPWFQLGYALGSLGEWFREVQLKTAAVGDDTPTFQKLLTLQSLEFYPAEWLYLSVVGTAIWGKRFELGYLTPLMYPVIHQNLHGDIDNVGQVVNLALRFPGYFKLYFSFFADEMEFSGISEFFTKPRNMVAYQTGLKIPIPGLPLSLFTFQYTKLEPFVYAHYTEKAVSALDHPVDLSYTHDGENLGYALPPNSDEFLVKLEAFFHPQWFSFIQFQLIRHGTNAWGGTPTALIYGDVDIPFNYTLINNYPDKHFLHDGYYDWNTIVTCGTQFSLHQLPLTVGWELSLAYTWWVMNQTGITPPAATWRTILGLKIQIFT